MSLRVLCALFLEFILIGCQPASVKAPAIGSTDIFSPGATPSASETIAPAPTSTPLPTSAAHPAILETAAGPLCENAFSALFEAAPLSPPFAVLKKTTYVNAPHWELSHQLPHMASLAVGDVQTIFCISETRTQTGTYTDGSAAYQIFWDVKAVSWPAGRVIGRNSFVGSPPPETKVSASASAKGSFPYPDFAAWIFHQVDHPDFLHFNDAITTLAISPDGETAAFGSALAGQVANKNYQAKIWLFDTSDMQIHAALEGHQGLVTSLAFSPDGKILASSGFDLFVKVWDVETRRLLGQVIVADTPNFLMFSPDGARLAVASNLAVAFIDPDSMQIEHSLPEANGQSLAFSPDGRQVYLLSLGSIKVVDPDANIVMLAFPDPFTLVPTMSVSSDGSAVTVSYESPESVEGFALSPDGTQIVTYTVDRSLDGAAGDENVRLATWDSKTGKYQGEIRFSADEVQAIKFSPDGKRLAMSNGSEIWLWDTTSWQVTKKSSGHVGLLMDLALSPDGTKILSASSDGTIRIWPVE